MKGSVRCGKCGWEVECEDYDVSLFSHKCDSHVYYHPSTEFHIADEEPEERERREPEGKEEGFKYRPSVANIERDRFGRPLSCKGWYVTCPGCEAEYFAKSISNARKRDGLCKDCYTAMLQADNNVPAEAPDVEPTKEQWAILAQIAATNPS